MKGKEIKIIFISIFLLVFTWIIFTIYHSSVTSTIPDALSTKIIPINPNFDTETLESIKKRIKISPVFELQKKISPTESMSPSVNLPLTSPTLSISTEEAGLLP